VPTLTGPNAVCFPLRVRGHVTGALEFEFDSDEPLADEGRAFLEAMADQCAQAIERAQLYTIERVRREELERSNRMKDDVFGIVSHELRTPLSAILGWARMLRQGMLDTPPANDRALDAIVRNAALLSRLVDDLLDVSRIVSGKLALETTNVDLGVVVEAAVDSVRPMLLAKNIEIATAAPPEPVRVRGDFRRLQQVLWNLLTNAIKFTPQGGRVMVRLVREEAAASIAVEDSGVGIPADVLPHVFERFKQADGTTTRRFGGLGLGLSIVRHVVEAHDGSVRAESEGEGRGAVIVVRLPMSDLGDADADALGQSAALPPRLDGVRALVLDDDADTRAFLWAVLESAGGRVRATDCAQSAIDAIRDFHPDVIVADIAMPGEDGYAFIRRLRALTRPAGGHTPAIALSALARAEDRTRAISAGFQVHVSKPVAPDDLVVAVAALIGVRNSGA
jgi:signal transduction histidine kinase/ActR/RegA family two-component response regulator